MYKLSLLQPIMMVERYSQLLKKTSYMKRESVMVLLGSIKISKVILTSTRVKMIALLSISKKGLILGKFSCNTFM